MAATLKLAARSYDLEGAALCVEAGFPRLEVGLPFKGGSDEEREWVALAAGRDIAYLGHGPREGDPRDLNQLAGRYLPLLCEALDTAARLGVTPFTVHMWLESRVLSQKVIEGKIALLQQVFEYGRERGIRVHLENLSESAEDLGAALDRIPGLALTLDLGHAQLMAESNASFRIIEEHYERIGHLHLHDNHGGKGAADDLHLIPGRGIVPFGEIFSKLKQRGYCGAATIENQPDQLIEAADFVRKTWAAS